MTEEASATVLNSCDTCHDAIDARDSPCDHTGDDVSDRRRQRADSAEGTDEDGGEQAAQDPKRLRRMLSNRASAKRSRQRRQERLGDLERQSAALRVEHAALARKFRDATDQARKAGEENQRLRSEMAVLQAEVEELRASRGRTAGMGGEIGEERLERGGEKGGERGGEKTEADEKTGRKEGEETKGMFVRGGAGEVHAGGKRRQADLTENGKEKRPAGNFSQKGKYSLLETANVDGWTTSGGENMTVGGEYSTAGGENLTDVCELDVGGWLSFDGGAGAGPYGRGEVFVA